MAEVLFYILLFSLVSVSLFQAGFVWNFFQFLNRNTPQEPKELVHGARDSLGEKPFVSVFLCLRGADPTLERCVRGLASQTYQDFEVLCMVDHETDPSCDLLTRWVGDDKRFQTFCISDPPTDRSLKCNSLVTAAKNMSEQTTIVAMVDADVDVDSNWLHDLVAPFEDDEIGLVSGNRWFLASDRRMGSMVRMIWNAAALPQMLAYKIPWGGSMAFRVEAAEKAKIFERWEKTLFDDVLVGPAIEKAGYRIVQLPNLFMGNDESCSVGGALRWMTRQLMDTRFYHWSWSMVAAHGINSFFVLALGVVATLWLAIDQKWILALLSLAAVKLFWIQNAFLLRSMEARVIRKVEHRKSSQESRLGWLNLGWLMILVQIIHFVATIKAGLATKMDWRHIRYRIKNSDDILMTNYRPMSEIESQIEKTESI